MVVFVLSIWNIGYSDTYLKVISGPLSDKGME
jgi:hypothetical protein